jgi:hypothetical protein
MLEKDKNSLKKLFIEDIDAAIKHCQDLLSSDFNGSFSSFLKTSFNPKNLSICQVSSSISTLFIHCNQCSLSPNSCICLSCFLKSNHSDHDIRIDNGNYGNCDCGDHSLWKSCGYCSDHSGQSSIPHETQVPDKIQHLLIDICSCIFQNIKKINDKNLKKITSFLQQIISLGDGFRRYVCIGICFNNFLINLIKTIPDLNNSSNSILFDFIGRFINDSYFKEQFSFSLFQETGNLFLYYKNLFCRKQSTNHLKPFSRFICHIFSPDIFEQ